jgi:hypothetical protein
MFIRDWLEAAIAAAREGVRAEVGATLVVA